MSKQIIGEWKVESEITYESFPIFTLKKSRRINPRTKQPTDFVRIEGLDWANIISLTPNNEVVLIRQYRHGSEEFTIEIPGGCIEEGEDPGESALRELKEETGYKASTCEPLGWVRPNPALLSNKCYFFLAKNVEISGAQILDPGEDIQVFTQPLTQVIAQIQNGEITHALVVAAFGFLALKHPELINSATR
jgi:ADP-ribose pyrophosphatase